MILCVLSISGNVGKSTLARQCLQAFGPAGTGLVTVETINADENPGERFGGSAIEDILAATLADPHSIIDVGSSNAEAFVANIKNLGDLVPSEVALWVVPVTPDAKVRRDTEATISGLLELGIAAKRIVLVLNRLGLGDIDLMTAFAADMRKRYKVTLVADALLENEAFARVAPGELMRDVARDETDYATAMRTGTTEERRAVLTKRVTLKMAAACAANLQAVASAVWAKA